MALRNFFIEKPLNIALNKIKDSLMLTKLGSIGTINKLRIENKCVVISINIKGITEEITVICKNIKPSSDNSEIELSDFVCNIEGIQAALNLVPSITVPIPEGGARSGVAAAKLLLGL